MRSTTWKHRLKCLFPSSFSRRVLGSSRRVVVGWMIHDPFLFLSFRMCISKQRKWCMVCVKEKLRTNDELKLREGRQRQSIFFWMASFSLERSRLFENNRVQSYGNKIASQVTSEWREGQTDTSVVIPNFRTRNKSGTPFLQLQGYWSQIPRSRVL